jgi:hypothetical protein
MQLNTTATCGTESGCVLRRGRRSVPAEPKSSGHRLLRQVFYRMHGRTFVFLSHPCPPAATVRASGAFRSDVLDQPAVCKTGGIGRSG